MLKHVETEVLELTIAEKGFDLQAKGEPCFILMLHITQCVNITKETDAKPAGLEES